MRIIGVTSMAVLALTLFGCESQDLSSESLSPSNLGSLKPQYEYQIRLDPSRFENRTNALAHLQQWLIDLSDDKTVPGLKFKEQEIEVRPIRRVEKFDTGNGDLQKRGWVLRRREALGSGKTDLTLKANGKTTGQATEVLFAIEKPEFKLETKLENDIYAAPSLTKWGYSVSFEPKKNSRVRLPASSEIKTIAVITEWFPDAAQSLKLPRETKLTGKTMYQWTGRYSLKLGAEKVELDLVLPYSSQAAASDGNGKPINPELSWKPELPGGPSLRLQTIIREAWAN